MIHEFSFGNFKSFKDINSLNMTSAKINDLDNKGVITNKVPLIKSKAIYGANASGKSNIIKALVAYKRIVKFSVKNNEILGMVENFRLSTNTEKEPTFFQLIFRVDDIVYRYGFEATNEKITSEWLYGKPNVREIPFFIRENNLINKIDKLHFSEGYKRLSLFENDEDNIFDEKSLFLTTVASLKGNKSQNIVNYIDNICVISGLKDDNLHLVTKRFLENIDTKDRILKLLKLADTGIENIHLYEFSEKDFPKDFSKEMIENLKNQKHVFSEHKKYDSRNEIIDTELFNFILNESEGTQKLFEISSVLLFALSKGSSVVVDEFDARFHPLISKKIVELFNSEENKNAQLVFVTHDTNLLSNKILRRDQIDFVEKDKYGSSHLYSLVKFKGVRKSASFEKDYIQGKYGAIPYLGDFNQVLKSDDDA